MTNHSPSDITRTLVQKYSPESIKAFMNCKITLVNIIKQKSAYLLVDESTSVGHSIAAIGIGHISFTLLYTFSSQVFSLKPA